MKGDFVIKFIFGIFEFMGELSEGLSRIPYKGVRFNDLNIYGYPHRKTYLGFKNLERRGLIKYISDDSFQFTKKGKMWIEKASLKYFSKRYPKWDKKWRLIIFDIPSELNNKRDILRRRLKYMGFIMLQRSVFAIPYPCEEELSDICAELKIGDYVDIIIADSIGSREEELINLFKVKR